jgi:peptidoglycan/LPS O-acetylase OafA/YrhL
MPAAWICATITLAARLLMLHEPIGDLVKPYLHSMVLWPEGAWIDGVYWSLAVELSFYAIVFAMLLARASRLLPLLAWGLSFLTAGYLLLGAGHAGTASGGWWMVNQHAELLLLRHGAFFAAGIWLYRSSQGQLTLAGWAGLVLALGVGGSEIWIKAGEVMSAEAHAALGQPRLAPLLVWSAAMVGLFAFSRWPKAFTPRSKRVQSVFKRIGGATYPLYLVHQIVGVALLRLLVERGLAPPIALVCAIAAMLALAFALSIHAEPAVRGVLRGRLDQLELTLAGLASRRGHGRP